MAPLMLVPRACRGNETHECPPSNTRTRATLQPLMAPNPTHAGHAHAAYGSSRGEPWHECSDCGLVQRIDVLRPGEVATCMRCNFVLRRRQRDSLSTALALAIAGFILMIVVAAEPLMLFRLTGQERQTTMFGLPQAFSDQGMPLPELAVAFTTLLAPALRLGLTAAVLAGLRLRVPRALLAGMARVREWLQPWAMVEVFLLGLFVAYTRLAALSEVHIELAVYALVALMLFTASADAWLDEVAMWDAIGRHGPPLPESEGSQTIACDTCGLINHCQEGDPCPRCDTALEHRKRNPLARCCALVVTGAVLYIPANLYPVLTVVRLGRGAPSTILGGVVELAQASMYPLALLVLVASIVVPSFKLVGLVYLLVTTWCRSPHHLIGRTRLYRIIDFIGRWSMIDVFMAGILTALVRMGMIGSVTPGLGVQFFCAVVIITMIAVMMFDPRVMWDAAGQNGTIPASQGRTSRLPAPPPPTSPPPTSQPPLGETEGVVPA